MKRFGGVFIFSLLFFLSFASFSYSAPKKAQVPKKESEENAGKKSGYTPREVSGEAVILEESFAYVLQGHEKTLNGRESCVSDVGYFAAEVNTYGELVGVPRPEKLESSARIHLVVVCNSLSLSHMVLNPSFKIRDNLIEDIVYSARKFDGLQIDFELIPKRDMEHFHEFLSALSYKIRKRGKIFSVCVPARTRGLKNDIFDYEKIASLSDKVVVMAYDEHWAGGRAGAVASMDWGRNVARHALETIGEEKLLMGVPFYGRSWAAEKTATAWYHSGAVRIMRENEVLSFCYKDDIPYAKLRMNVDVELYFDDAYSLITRLREYKKLGVKRAAFWCMGQEDVKVWSLILLHTR